MSQKFEDPPYELEKQETFLARVERTVKMMAFPFIALSTWLTTKGLFDAKIEADAANTEGMITAAMMALVAAIMIGGANMLLFGLATHASKKQRWQLIGLTVAILPFVAAISTYNAILATSADRSVILALRDRSAEWTDYVEATSRDAINAKAAEASLRPLRASLCTMAAGEKNGGLLSGSRGTGAISAAYTSACQSVTSIIDTLADTVLATDARRAEATQIVADMDAIIRNSAVNVYERQAQFKVQDRVLRKLMDDVSAERVADRLAVQMSALESSASSFGSQKDGSFGVKQEQAVTSLKASLASISGALNGLVAPDASQNVQPPEAMLSVDQAISRYWKSNISTIAIAIASDSFSLWLIAFLFVARGMVQQRKEEILSETTNNEEKSQ